MRTDVDLGENTIGKWNNYEDLGRSMKKKKRVGMGVNMRIGE